MISFLTSSSKWLGVFFCASLIVGCAPTAQLYHWGNYENQVYSRFTAATTPEQQIQEMEKTLQINKSNRPSPPGFHAHLGFLYGDVGRMNEMREQFTIEKQLFPEATAFMDFLLHKATKPKGNAQ
jgi:hypothetical protein